MPAPESPGCSVLVAGASGRTGRLTVAAARRAGLRVRGLTSSAAHTEGLRALGVDDLIVGDLLQPETATRAVEGIDAVVCAVGARGQDPGRERIFTVGVPHLIDAARAAGTAYCVLLTSLGVGRSAAAVQPAFRASRRLILAAMTGAEEHLRRSGVLYTIVRPGRLTDEDATHDVVVGAGGTAIGSGTIPRADVACILVAALFTPEVQNQTIEILSRAGAHSVSDSAVVIPWH